MYYEAARDAAEEAMDMRPVCEWIMKHGIPACWGDEEAVYALKMHNDDLGWKVHHPACRVSHF